MIRGSVETWSNIEKLQNIKVKVENWWNYKRKIEIYPKNDQKERKHTCEKAPTHVSLESETTQDRQTSKTSPTPQGESPRPIFPLNKIPPVFYFPVKALITRNSRVFFSFKSFLFLVSLERQEENPANPSTIIIPSFLSAYLSPGRSVLWVLSERNWAFLSWSLSWFLFI
jgi:hypothetical protein